MKMRKIPSRASSSRITRNSKELRPKIFGDYCSLFKKYGAKTTRLGKALTLIAINILVDYCLLDLKNLIDIISIYPC